MILMDPVAHTLVGAALAETRFARRVPLAATTLVVAANVPDVDGVTYFVSGDLALLIRRGWTHGVLAMAALPVAVTAFALLLDKLRRRRLPDAPAAPPGRLLALAGIAVLTHPAMDWMNNYGVRLLMPFDGRWFYGDALFILDPWFWLMAATPVVLVRSRGRLAILAWLTAAAVATAVILRSPLLPAGARIAWLLLAGAVAAWRVMRGPRDEAPHIALAALLMLAAYCAVMVTGTRLARTEATRWAAELGLTPEHVAPVPVPGNPFARDVFVVLSDRYVFASVDALASPRVRAGDAPIGRHGAPADVVAAAMTAPQVQGLRRWIRFPAYEVSPLPDGYRVLVQDVRFSRMRRAGIGYMIVDVDRALRPKTWPAP
jgi:inner membrane protein